VVVAELRLIEAHAGFERSPLFVYLDLVAVVVRQPDGTLSLALGPVLSYYEFKWPMSDRLTDQAWREKLAAQPAPRPAWTAAFVQ